MKEIIAEYGGLIRSIIKKITGSYNEDIEQEVYIKTWKNMDNYKEQGKFSGWLSTLTANVCRDYFKSKQHIMESKQVSGEEILDKVKVGGRQEEVIDAKKRQKIILKAVDDLPRKMRQVVILFEFEEKSYEEISKKLGLPVGTIKSRLFNARKILSEKLKFLKEN